MKRLIGLLALAAAMMIPTSAAAIPLTNTQVNQGNICSLFDCGSAVASVLDSFAFNPGALTPDGNSAVTVLKGKAAGAAAGLYLYNYDLLNFTNSTETLHGYSVDFGGLVTTLDLNGDGNPDTSWWTPSCGGIPGSAGCGAQAPTGADFTGSAVSFIFAGGILPNGLITADFGVISTLPPGAVKATVLNTIETAAPDSLAPVPEPGTMLLLGSGLTALAMRRRRRS